MTEFGIVMEASPGYTARLAREIEAWAGAGQPERAQLRAHAYLAQYPRGLFRDAVLRWSQPGPRAP